MLDSMNWRKTKAVQPKDYAVCTNEELLGNNYKSIEARGRGREKGGRKGEVRAKIMGHTGQNHKC